MSTTTAISPSRLEELVKPVDEALEAHDFEKSEAITVDSACMAVFKKGEVTIEYTFKVERDAVMASYDRQASVDLKLALKDGEYGVSVYDMGYSTNQIRTEDLVKRMINSEQGAASTWPDPTNVSALSHEKGLRGRLDEVLGQVPIRYAIKTKATFAVTDLARNILRAYNPRFEVQYVSINGKANEDIWAVVNPYHEDSVYFSIKLTDIPPNTWSPRPGGHQFEVLVGGKNYIPLGFDAHRFHLAVKETQKALGQ